MKDGAKALIYGPLLAMDANPRVPDLYISSTKKVNLPFGTGQKMRKGEIRNLHTGEMRST